MLCQTGQRQKHNKVSHVIADGHPIGRAAAAHSECPPLALANAKSDSGTRPSLASAGRRGVAAAGVVAAVAPSSVVLDLVSDSDPVQLAAGGIVLPAGRQLAWQARRGTKTRENENTEQHTGTGTGTHSTRNRARARRPTRRERAHTDTVHYTHSTYTHTIKLTDARARRGRERSEVLRSEQENNEHAVSASSAPRRRTARRSGVEGEGKRRRAVVFVRRGTGAASLSLSPPRAPLLISAWLETAQIGA